MRIQLINDFIENQIQQIYKENEYKTKDLEYKVVELTKKLKYAEEEKNKEINKLKKEQTIRYEKNSSIKWIENVKYYNLSDFCEIIKHIFLSMKQS